MVEPMFVISSIDKAINNHILDSNQHVAYTISSYIISRLPVAPVTKLNKPGMENYLHSSNNFVLL